MTGSEKGRVRKKQMSRDVLFSGAREEGMMVILGAGALLMILIFFHLCMVRSHHHLLGKTIFHLIK